MDNLSVDHLLGIKFLNQNDLEKITSLARDKIAKDLDLIDEDVFCFFVGLLIIRCLRKMK